MAIEVRDVDGVRLLQFGTHWCQGALRLATPDRLELEYAAGMFAWLLFHDPDALPQQHLATLGLGAGSLTRFAHGVLGLRTTAVEIDEEVIAVCRRDFLLPPDGERLQVVGADGAAFIARPASRAAFDVLQVDAYDAAVARPALDGEAFYAACRAALRPQGTVVVNLVGTDLDVRASVAGLRAGLRPQAVWQLPPTEAGNRVVIAHCGAMPHEDLLQARAATIAQRWDLPAAQWLAAARRGPGRIP